MSKWWFMRSSAADPVEKPWLSLEASKALLAPDKAGSVIQICLPESSGDHTHQAVYLGLAKGVPTILHAIKPLMASDKATQPVKDRKHLLKRDLHTLPVGSRLRVTDVAVFPKKTRFSAVELKEKLFEVAEELERADATVREAECSCHHAVELFMKRCFYVGFRRCAFEPGDLITIHQSIHSDEAEQKSVVHPHKAIYLGAFNGEELIVHGVYRQTNSDCQLIGENSIPKVKQLTIKVDKLYDVAKEFEMTGTGTCAVGKSAGLQEKSAIVETLMKRTLKLSGTEARGKNDAATCADFVVSFLEECDLAVGKKTSETRARNTAGTSDDHINIEGGFSTQVEWGAGATALAVLGAVLGIAVKIMRR